MDPTNYSIRKIIIVLCTYTVYTDVMNNAIYFFPLLLAGTVVAAEPVRLDTGTGILYGTLEVPNSKGPFPAALLIAGSGDEDRDGNSAQLKGKNNCLRLIAEALASRGIASLRYDQRGVAASRDAVLMDAEHLHFDTYVDDAVGWSEYLRKDSRFRGLVIIGHSQGSLTAMLAAQKLSANGYVSIAGLGQPGGQTILRQIRAQGTPPDMMKPVEDIVKTLEEGGRVESVPAGLASLFRPSIQPYLISYFKYDPVREIGKLTVPVLILQGTTDLTVGVNDAKLLAAGNPSAKLVLIEGMNHVLKEVPAEKEKQLASYSDASLPLAGKLVEEIAGLIHGLKAAQ